MELILKYFPGLKEQQVAQLAALENLYREWNARINVISRKDTEGFYERHVLHSMSIAKTINFEKGASVVDIGTGGGFPGIPLAILFPAVNFHLVDSIGKKIKVVNAIKEAVDLQNVTTEHNRAEQIKHIPFDYAVSRAVAPLKDLIAWSRPLLGKKNRPSVNRELICLKGGDLAQEISESNARPQLFEIAQFYSEPYFDQKYILRINMQ